MVNIKIKIKPRMENIARKNARRTLDKKSSEAKSAEVSSLKERTNIYDRVGKGLLFLLIFLLPIFFIPIGNGYPLELSKQILFEVLIFVTLFVFLFGKLKSREFNFVWSPLHIGVLTFLFMFGLSTVFSVWRYGSFWGISLDVGRTFLTMFLFVLFYFLFANIFKEDKSVYRAVVVFLTSVFLVTIFSILQLFGKFLLPWGFTRASSFNPIGTANNLALLVAILLPIIAALEIQAKKVAKIVLWIFSLTFLFYLLLVNFKVAWLALSVGMTILFILEMVNIKKVKENSLVLPVLLLTLAIFFSIFTLSMPLLPRAPLELSVSQKAEIGIARGVLKEHLFLGSGPGTFVYDFLKFKPKVLNQTVVWNTVFSKGASEILDMTVTTGILGILSFFFMIGIFFWFLSKKVLSSVSFLRWGMFAAFVSLIFVFFFHSANFLSWFLLFFLMSAFVALINNNNFNKNKNV